METPPPGPHLPTAKDKKYDRQLRLWAAAGQRALEEAHVLLIVGGEDGSNSSVTGVETLKNLVLPGIGKFSIADCAKVTEADVGVNFFLEPESLGKSRAKETVRLLEELNPDSKGRAVIYKDLQEWFSNSGSCLATYTLIIVCGPVSEQVLDMTRSYKTGDVPIIYVHCAGFYSYFTIELPSTFPIVDPHPDPDSTQDLRLLAPWPELMSEVKKLGPLEDLDDHAHGHVPYILLLLHYLEEWKTLHSGTLPSTFKEKTEFRNLVQKGARTNNSEGGEENFDEACAAVIKSLNPPSIGGGCTDMLETFACTQLTEHSTNFWIIANAIKTFYSKHSVLPLPGSLPDMKARSADYISLQNIYKSKARADVAEVLETVRSSEDILKRDKFYFPKPIPETEVEQFCKNAAHVKVLSGRPLIHARLDDPEVLNALAKSLDDPNALESHLTPIFLSLLQTDYIHEITAAKLNKLANGNELEEVKRAQHGELHNIASLTGGQVAQEAIKLITRQYIPVDNLCIFDGIASRAEVLNF